MRIILSFLCFLFLSCNSQPKVVTKTEYPVYEKNKNAITIAFGSCSDEDKPQPLWKNILAEAPDIWLWLGDNIYGDTQDMDKMRRKYKMQKDNPDYQELLKTTLVEGVWDDHDYGKNDAGKEYPTKVGSQEAFLDFFDVPQDDPRRTRLGTYHSFTHSTNVGSVKFILLDTRYFRDALVKENGENAPNMEGTILGEEQWTWFAQELNNSSADIHIIASSIQAIPEEHIYEKWANFPKERDRLFDLISTSKAKHPILLSGDRHIAEVSMIGWKETDIYDITSSSLTHGWNAPAPEANKHRIGDIVYKENYGVLIIEKENIIVRLMSKEGLEEEVVIGR